MKAVLQRARGAKVTVNGEIVASIAKGLVILLGVGPDDDPQKAREFAEKCARLRIFEDDQDKMNLFLKEPELETNAGADDYGQSDIKISNAVAIDGLPPVNMHSYSFGAGTHELKLGKGVCLILGFLQGDQVIPVYDAGLMSDKRSLSVDWLFE